MPRGKKRRKKNKKIEKPPEEKKPEQTSSDPEEFLFNLDEFREFIKADGPYLAVCYVFDTNQLGYEDNVAKIKLEMIKALQRAATNRRMNIQPSKIQWKTYPRGDKTYVKAWFNLYDATGPGAPTLEEATTVPKNPDDVYVMEPERRLR